MQAFIDQVERDGYAIWPGFLDKALTKRIREHMDSLLPPPEDRSVPKAKRLHGLKNGTPGAIMAEILDNPRLFELAQSLLHTTDLRLLEQVLIRTDPQDASLGPVGPTGWHVDMSFLPEHYQARPRQVYFQMVHALSPVELGGGGTMVLPGSHLKAYEATKNLGPEKFEEYRKDPVKIANLDPSKGIELNPKEGDLLVFNPMCLHSASVNTSDRSRYVYFASFYHPTAKHLMNFLTNTKYPRAVSDDMRKNLRPELQPLLAEDWNSK